VTAGHELGFRWLSINPTTFYFGSANATYDQQILAFADVLAGPVSLIEPKDKAKDQGIMLSTVDLTQTVLLTWEPITGAVNYEYQVANDEGFLSLDANNCGVTTGQQWRADGLIPDRTYYWRVRVSTPLLSPWSAGRSFTISEVEVIGAPEVEVEFDIVSPERGASGIPVQPVFVWAAVEGAESYELMVAEDKTFAIIEWSHTADTNFYQGDEVLAYGTTYYWRVRVAKGEWANGVFTTVEKPAEVAPPVIVEKEPAPPPEIKVVEVEGAAPAIPDYLLWTIVGVGAVLVIALIVLIVRTRRAV
jgi:hypothetical protein